jgi:hypothetical protein
MPSLPIQLPVSGFDPSSFFAYITSHPDEARNVINFGVGLFNATHPSNQIKLPGAVPAAPAAAPAAPGLGMEHVGFLGLLATLFTQSKGFDPSVLSGAGQILTSLFGGLMAAGTLGKIGPTIGNVVGLIAKLALIPK